MNELGIQPYDILMLAVLLAATIFGAWKGMAWQLASLASLVVSAVVALQFGGVVGAALTDAPWGRYAGMLILYLVTSLGVWLAFRLVAEAIDRVKLQEFDRQVGALFGLAKGIMLCLVITFFAVTLSEAARQVVLRTYSGRYIAMAIQKGAPMMPDDVRRVLGRYVEQLDRKLDPATPADAPAMPAPPGQGAEEILERIENELPPLPPLPAPQPQKSSGIRSARSGQDWE